MNSEYYSHFLKEKKMYVVCSFLCTEDIGHGEQKNVQLLCVPIYKHLQLVIVTQSFLCGLGSRIVTSPTGLRLLHWEYTFYTLFFYSFQEKG